MAKALRTNDASGYLKRGGITPQLTLGENFTESELFVVINATYKQLLNQFLLNLRGYC